MTQETKQNPQDELASSLEGIFVVDAGAGTGKTHTIIRRYQNLIEAGVNPKDILLITFTRNAAGKLKEEVINKISSDTFSIMQLLEAPVLNFHSLCARILKNYGTSAPGYLGMKETLTSNFNIVESYIYEKELFRKFYLSFKKDKMDKYTNVFLSLNDDHETLLRIIRKLSNSGIFPLDKGWFNDGERLLSGDSKEFAAKFEELNEAKLGKKGKENENDLLKIVKSTKDKFYRDFYFEDVIDEKRVRSEIHVELFHDKSFEDLREFMRDVYHSYIEFMLKKNILNFDFVVMFAFLLLYNDDDLRKKSQYEYAMVDEFQDTDEIQFLLLMLLMKEKDGKANFAVVGDWRQGIFGFRNTTIENITGFEERLKTYKKVLNADKKRITYDTSEVRKITFEYNYRSSQEILDFSRHSLFCKTKSEEVVDFGEVEEKFKKPLAAKRQLSDLSEIEFYQSQKDTEDDEVEMILRKISELVNEDKYKVREFGSDGKIKGERRVRLSDICVLSRRNSFGLKLQKAGLEKGIPVNYGGGLELFSTQQGILVLAWLRLMLNESDGSGWLPVLEKEGYNFAEINQILGFIKEDKNNLFNIPGELKKFLESLKSFEKNIPFLIESILSRYGFNDEFGNSILSEVGNWLNADIISIAELVKLMNNLSAETYVIEVNKGTDAVVSQTIHSVKGLEYPVVIVANVNQRTFPSTLNTVNDIFYHQHPGLRFRKEFGVKGEYAAIFNNWKTDIIIGMFKPENYDEERRLLYVAVTRAKQYLYFTCYNPSEFFRSLSRKAGKEITEDFDYEIISLKEQKELQPEKIYPPVYSKPAKSFVSVHGLMEESELDEATEEPDMSYVKYMPDAIEYGKKLHQIAYKLANGMSVNTGIKEVERIKEFISDLKANELKAEVDFIFPRDDEVIRGTIDLLAFYDDRIEVIDYKTDKSRDYESKYEVQLGIYKEVIESIFPDKKVVGKIFYVRLNEIVEI